MDNDSKGGSLGDLMGGLLAGMLARDGWTWSDIGRLGGQWLDWPMLQIGVRCLGAKLQPEIHPNATVSVALFLV